MLVDKSARAAAAPARRPCPRRDRESRWCRSAYPCGARHWPRARRALWRPRSGSIPTRAASAAPPSRSISWNSAPGRSAQRIGQRFDGAGARGRIGDAMDIGLLDQDGLRVAGDAARERVGQPERHAERQHGHGIGAADRGAERGDGAAHDVPVRIALGHHAPGSLGGDEGRPRLEPAGLLDARPQFPQARGTWRWSGTDPGRRRGGNR